MRWQVFGHTRRYLSSRRKKENYSSLASALRVFHEKNDHFLVPSSFQVPQKEATASWPEQTYGMKLGHDIRTFVKALSSTNSSELQDVRRQLDAIGFPIIRDWKRFWWTEVSLAALTKYKAMKGHLLVPRAFVVPKDNEQWPKSTWGLQLGSHVNFLRQKRNRLMEYQLQDLDDIGFVWVVADYHWDMVLMPALRRYHDMYGHCNVPQTFIIGEQKGSDQWPQEVIGYRLGAAVNRIRAGSAYAAHVKQNRKKLEKLGVYLNSHDRKWTKTILPAFQTYYRIYGSCNIDTLFIVPEDEQWPPSTWRTRLGFIAQNIRNRGDFLLQIAQDFDQLKAIGFVWNLAAAKWENAVMPALRTYVVYHRKAHIPANFVVPSKSPWPTESHGLKLGKFATNAMHRKQFAEFIEIDRMELNTLGFFWNSKETT